MLYLCTYSLYIHIYIYTHVYIYIYTRTGWCLFVSPFLFVVDCLRTEHQGISPFGHVSRWRWEYLKGEKKGAIGHWMKTWNILGYLRVFIFKKHYLKKKHKFQMLDIIGHTKNGADPPIPHLVWARIFAKSCSTCSLTVLASELQLEADWMPTGCRLDAMDHRNQWFIQWMENGPWTYMEISWTIGDWWWLSDL